MSLQLDESDGVFLRPLLSALGECTPEKVFTYSAESGTVYSLPVDCSSIVTESSASEEESGGSSSSTILILIALLVLLVIIVVVALIVVHRRRKYAAVAAASKSAYQFDGAPVDQIFQNPVYASRDSKKGHKDAFSEDEPDEYVTVGDSRQHSLRDLEMEPGLVQAKSVDERLRSDTYA